MALPLIAMGVGAAANLAGSIISANAQSDAAKKMAEQAAAEREEAKKAAMPTAQELRLLQQQITIGEKNLSRVEKLLKSVDPTLIEAGAQALKLMRGQESAVVRPLADRRARQRAELSRKLYSQLGSGAETSSAGIEALNKFDADTDLILSQVQQQSLNQLMGYLTANKVGYEDAAGTNMAAAGLAGNLQGRQVAAIRGNSLVNTAGAPFLGAALGGKTLAGVGSNLMQLGSTAMTLNSLYGTEGGGQVGHTGQFDPDLNSSVGYAKTGAGNVVPNDDAFRKYGI